MRIEHEDGLSFKTNERIKIHFTLVMLFFDRRKKRSGFFHFFIVAFLLLEGKGEKQRKATLTEQMKRMNNYTSSFLALSSTFIS